MKIYSVNVGLPKKVNINGKDILTAIYKTEISTRIWLDKLSLAGDGQADHTVHGGIHQAVYCYPLEHYKYWQTRLNKDFLEIGTFGENFTITGLLEDEVQIGDIFQIGIKGTGPIVQVTMPRIPCFKFGHKVGHPNILSDFLHSGHSGFYQRVLKEGEVGSGDNITLLERAPESISIRTALGLQKLNEGDVATLKKALSISSLAPLLREIFEARLESEFS